MPNLKLYLLGTPYLTVDEQLIEFTRKKSLALLAYLTLSGARCRRDSLTTLLWPDYDEERARAGLRRTLASITSTPVRPWLHADRQHVWLSPTDTIWCDALELSQNDASPPAAEHLLSLYRGPFLSGFSLKDSDTFDEWQTLQAQTLETRYTLHLNTYAQYYLDSGMLIAGLETTRRWLSIDPYHEQANLILIRLLAQSNQTSAALQHYHHYAQLLKADLETAPSPSITTLANQLETGRYQSPPQNTPNPRINVLPPPPRMVIGREAVLADLRQRLTPSPHHTSEIVLQGWPGIGKTTLSTALAYDPTLHARYPDGVMWLALGQHPKIQSLLAIWCQAAQLDFDPQDDVETISARLRSHLAHHRILFILDDIWDAADAPPFRVAGPSSATLMTTRFNDIAHTLVSQPHQFYRVPIISDADARDLLYTLAPSLRQHSQDELNALIRDLEGLPLALQVAGRLLHAESNMGWGISHLIQDLRKGQRLLQSQAPADRHEIARQTSPTIAALIQRSVDRLSPDLQEKFALLGVFAPKPASFTLAAAQAIWKTDRPHDAIRILSDRGLLEPTGDGRFQMHALLVVHARSMFQE